MPVAIVGLTSVLAAVSPLAELGSALHAAGDPGHHAAGLPPMDAALRARARRWAFTTRAIRAVSEFLEFLEESWHGWFAARWPAVRPVLEAR